MEKTLQELYEEVIKDEKLIKEFTEAEHKGKVEEFVKAHGCSATEKEIKEFMESKMSSGKELSTDELDQVAGGKAGRYVDLKCDKCGKVFSHDADVWEGKKHSQRHGFVIKKPCDGILKVIKVYAPGE